MKKPLSDEDIYFEYAPEQPEIPFTMIPHELIRNKNMSADCRLLIIFLLSNRGDWKIHITQVRNSFEEGLGRNKFYRILKEARESGYVRREIIRDEQNRKFKKFTYRVYANPEFKKCLPPPESAFPGFRYMQIGYTKEEYKNKKEDSSSSSSLRSEEKEVLSEVPETASIPPPVRADARRLSFFFLSKLREESPKLKEPNMDKWEHEFDLMLRRDKRSVSEVEALIDWWRDSWWYRHGARSPAKFRERFDDMQIQMKEKKGNGNETIRKNSTFASEKGAYHPEMRGLVVMDTHVFNKHTNKELHLDVNSEEFREKLYELFGMKYDPRRH